MLLKCDHNETNGKFKVPRNVLPGDFVSEDRTNNVNQKRFHREPEHFISNKNKYAVIYLCPCVFFESFRRDLNEAKVVYISEYYLICRFVIMTHRLRLKFRVTSLTMNSHRGRHSQVLRFHNGRSLIEKRVLLLSLDKS